MNKYTPIIGLEVHVELKTNSKMFCRCTADYFGKEPNSHTCPVCLGLPGALPVPNKTAIDWCIKIALALNCKINEFSKFDRKNYFYPDLAKGYQISQYDLPFGHDGYVILGSNATPESNQKKDAGQASMTKEKRIGITRVHMEEDTGKLTHAYGASLIDFNRSGVPLVEIVTEPDFHDAADVKEYLQKLQQIVRYLEVSNADMEKGDMRLEPNISLTTDVKVLPNYKVEVKNINSFRFVEKSITFEIKRQTEILEKGETPAQETRGWDENRQKTVSQRSKENAHDYRYFPEPDIPPTTHTKAEISSLKKSLPELPDEKMVRFAKIYALPVYDAEILTRERSLADYFEEVVSLCHPELVSGSQKQEMPKRVRHDITPKEIANWIINKKIDHTQITPDELLTQITAAKQTIAIDETELVKIITEVISENEQAVTDYKSGKENALMFLLGQVMRKLGKKVDVQMVKEKIKQQVA
ncbi:MAG: Asp-tRNA(Asn)/Glu-tRNA(Gln) amidotransferase subunit GatB [Patescibacteria group bacterium]